MTGLQQSIAIGPAAFTIGTLLIVFAYFVALITGYFAGLRHQVRVSDTLFMLVIVSLVTARAVFVVRYWGSYDGFLAMLDIRDGGFDPAGGLIGGLTYTVWAYWSKIQIRKPLTTALVAGGLAWGITAGPLLMIEQQSRPLPQVTVSNKDGEQTGLTEFAAQHEQPMVINLWATWCPHCIREMPMFADAQEEMSDITFMFVNQGEDPSQVRNFISERDLEIDNIFFDPHNNLSNATGSHALPTTLFYDENGQLIDSRTGGISRARLESGLERLR
ncbi:thioredoxin [Halorhodospira halochloris]|uniref:Thioredoxin n=1 Tax=Halorhodospira halochloris TaxID=1052 RepID=A0A0X8XCV4_HALHR|nr:TlpA disulfide reductase family protein [Halorhodospira halochloris]MBK1651735.1 thiol:disulfide interchange protein [Halorhodospira halochloris]BAU58599.1 thioredoxin [Halorhodospira halochloris]